MLKGLNDSALFLWRLDVRKIVRTEQGFTLIDIISLLFILVILSSMAAPKCFDLQSVAEERTLQVALNDMKSRASIAFARSLLENGGRGAPDEYDTFSDLGFSNQGDLNLTYRDFAGTWNTDGTTTVTYAMRNDNVIWTFTLSEGTTTEPSDITLTGN